MKKLILRNKTGRYNLKQTGLSILFIMSFSITSIAAEYDATLMWSNRVELSTPVNGVVEKVFVKAGNIVAIDNILLQLDQRSFKAKLKQAKASFRSAKESSDETQRELKRQEEMYERAMLSEHDLQVTKNNNITALALLEQTEALLSQAKLELEYSAIRAPFNAVVIDSKAVKGQIVASEIKPPVLIVVAEANKMLARFYVHLKMISDLPLNKSAKVEVDGDTYHGIINNVGLEPQKSRPGYYPVYVLFNFEKILLRAGQNVKVEVE